MTREDRELYQIWYGMVLRCTDPRNLSYENYGGRGISVCKRWMKFENFVADVGRRPSKDYSIDRINNERDYEPNNVRWATRHEQTRNRRSTRKITVDGRVLCLKDAAEEVGLKPSTFDRRLRRGWSNEEAMNLPAMPRANSRPGARLLTADGKTQTLAQWSRDTGLTPAGILMRLKLGWSVKQALTTEKPERPNSKLTMEQARAIRKKYPKQSYATIAAEYDVSKKTVLNIVHRRIFVE